MNSTAFDRSLWRARRRQWLLPLVLFAVAVGLLSFYRAAYAGRLVGEGRGLTSERERLEQLHARRAALERTLLRAEGNEQGIARLYGEVFSTERARLTRFMREVRELAERAGLDRGAINYPEEELERHGLVRKSLVFTAAGDYQQLRQFINLLELSPSFVVLQQISVGDSGGLLQVQLDLSTFFVSSAAAPAPRVGAGG